MDSRTTPPPPRPEQNPLGQTTPDKTPQRTKPPWTKSPRTKPLGQLPPPHPHKKKLQNTLNTKPPRQYHLEYTPDSQQSTPRTKTWQNPRHR